MSIFRLLKQSIFSAFGSYELEGKRFYGLSLSYLILAWIFSLLVASITSYGMAELLYRHDLHLSILTPGHATPAEIHWRLNFYELLLTLNTLTCSIYAAFLLNEKKNGFRNSYGLHRIFTVTTRSTWMTFTFATIVLCIIHGFFFEPFYRYSDGHQSLMRFMDTLPETGEPEALGRWAHGIATLLMELFVYLLIGFVILSSLAIRLSMKNLIRFAAALLTTLLICWCLNSLIEEVYHLVSYHIIDLIRIPLSFGIITPILGTAIYAGVFATFYFFIATLVASPIAIQAQRLNETTVQIESAKPPYKQVVRNTDPQ